MPVQIQTFTLELNQEEVTPLAHHRPQVCPADEHLLHHEHSIRAEGDRLLHCDPPVCAVSDHALPDPGKGQENEPIEPTQLLKKQDSQTKSTLINCSERDQYAMLMEEALRRIANNLPDQDRMKHP